MIVAHTGPSRKNLSREQELEVVWQLEEQANYLDTWRSGCATGVDTIVAHQAILSGILVVELFVPSAGHNAKLVEELAPRAKVIRCPKGREPYRVRNTMMVTGADKLVAFVKQPTFYRSGEWMTVNIARRLGIEVDLYVI